jgi:hypothetical protein
MVKNIDATGGDVVVDSGEFPVDDVVPHKQGISSGPIPGVESTGFESIKDREIPSMYKSLCSRLIASRHAWSARELDLSASYLRSPARVSFLRKPGRNGFGQLLE